MSGREDQRRHAIDHAIAGPWLSHVVTRNASQAVWPWPVVDPSDHRDVGRVDGLHPDDVVAAVHMVNLPDTPPDRSLNR